MALPSMDSGAEQIKSKMLAMVRLREEINFERYHLSQTIDSRMQSDREKEGLESQMKDLENLEKECKESIKKAEEELEAVTEELQRERQNLRTFALHCGEGIVCESRDDVRAFYELVKWTGCVHKAVCLDRSCPNYNEVIEEAIKLRLRVHAFRT